MIKVDSNPAAIGDMTQVDDSIVGDAKATANALLAGLSSHIRRGWATPQLAARIAEIDPWEDAQPIERAGFASRHNVARMCNQILPHDRLVTVGVGHYRGLPATHVSIEDPRDNFLTWPFGSVGRGVAAALGAA